MALALASLTGLAAAQDRPATEDAAFQRESWDSETVRLFGTLPVQDGGRIKPMDTLAGFKLLKLNGKRSLKTPEGERLGHSEWLLDCLFFPDLAKTYACFLVQNSQVLTAIGLEHKNRRDRYSYEELVLGRTALFREASKINGVEATKRDHVERQILELANNLQEFEQLISALSFARRTLPTDGSPGLVEVYGESSRPGLAHVLARVPELMTAYRAAAGGLGEERKQEELRAMSALSDELEISMRHGVGAPPLFPPSRGVEEAPDWFVPTELARQVLEGEPVAQQIELLATLERMAIVRGDREAFRTELAAFHGGIQELAEARGEYGKVELETAYYGANYFTNALALFLLGFLAVAISWLMQPNRWGQLGIWISTGAGALLVIAGITVRCIIRSRPPVSTLYETILFITGCCVLVCLAIEWMNRQRIALALSTVLGAGGMFLAMKYELREVVTAGDTMPSLVAVLDTNFWLATHVTTITIGYAAGLLASAIAHVWILGKLLGYRRGDKAFYETVSQMTYGVLCFGLLFALVGTMLGGIWANYSWGRFWGWDPKENAALMICLWEIAMLQARLGGYIRDHGMAVSSVILGGVVVFSWWGVNLLGTGLHSYGDIPGLLPILMIYAAIESLVLVATGVVWLVTRKVSAVSAARMGSASP